MGRQSAEQRVGACWSVNDEKIWQQQPIFSLRRHNQSYAQKSLRTGSRGIWRRPHSLGVPAVPLLMPGGYGGASGGYRLMAAARSSCYPALLISRQLTAKEQRKPDFASQGGDLPPLRLADLLTAARARPVAEAELLALAARAAALGRLRAGEGS